MDFIFQYLDGLSRIVSHEAPCKPSPGGEKWPKEGNIYILQAPK